MQKLTLPGRLLQPMLREDLRLLIIVLVFFALLLVWALPEAVFLDPLQWTFGPLP